MTGFNGDGLKVAAALVATMASRKRGQIANGHVPPGFVVIKFMVCKAGEQSEIRILFPDQEVHEFNAVAIILDTFKRQFPGLALRCEEEPVLSC